MASAYISKADAHLQTSLQALRQTNAKCAWPCWGKLPVAAAGPCL